MIERMDLLETLADEHPNQLVFATLSGAHLYGFPSADSDFDLRGVHLACPPEFLGLGRYGETIEQDGIRDGREIDLVTHDARKFFRLMLNPNGYVLEQLFSPLVIRTSSEHEELIELGRGCITRHHVHHYRGFARNQWDLVKKEQPSRIKPLLYVYRVILTGIHLMKTGQIEANLLKLKEEYPHSILDSLIEAKASGGEQVRLSQGDMDFHENAYTSLLAELEEAGRQTSLRDEPTARAGLNALLVRMRMQSIDRWEESLHT